MKWNSGKSLNGRFISCLMFGLFAIFLLVSTSACTFPSEGWYQRMEQNLSDTREAVQKNQENTRLLAKNTDDEKLKTEWEKRLSGIRKSGQAPADKNSEDWVASLLYMVITMLGLGGVAKGAHFLYKIPPRPGGKI